MSTIRLLTWKIRPSVGFFFFFFFFFFFCFFLDTLHALATKAVKVPRAQRMSIFVIEMKFVDI